MSDPTSDRIAALERELGELQNRVAALERWIASHPPDPEGNRAVVRNKVVYDWQ